MPYYIKKKPLPKRKRQPSARTLIVKLDKVFSLYIRLRDSKPFGYKAFKCISCGKIKPFSKADCGHYYSRAKMSTRYDEENCNSECSSCLTPDALILMKDLTWKKLGSICVGDEVFSFDEEIKYKTSRRYRVGKVTYIKREIQDVYEVELENGDVIKTTANHKWLTRSKISSAYKWAETQEMWINGTNVHGIRKPGPHTKNITTTVCKPFMVVTQDNSRESGWIAGMIDADGHVTQQKIHNEDGTLRYGFRVGVAQCEKYPVHCKEIIRLIEKFTGNHKPCRQSMSKRTENRGIRCNYQAWQYLITGSNVEKLQFLMRVRPFKTSQVDIEKLGKLKLQYDCKVKSIRYAGKQEIVVMETSTHTYIANGYAMHNCNRFSADHLDGYRENLIAKIGQQRFDLLRVRANQTKKWSVFELQELIKYYTALVQKMESGK